MLYSHKAKTPQGTTITGEQDAQNESDLARLLKRQNLLLIASTSKEKGGGSGGFSLQRALQFLPMLGGVSVEERMMFSRNLAIMIDAGVPLTRAISTLSRQTTSARFAQTLTDLEGGISKGETFSGALGKHPEVFGNFYVSMVAAGEASGNVVEVLTLLAEQLRKAHELVSRIKGALVYPAVIITAMGIVGVAMMIFVVPTLAETFKDIDVELPPTTRMIFGAGAFLQAYWWTLLIAVPAVLFAFKKGLDSPVGKSIYDWTLLHIPVIGNVTKKVHNAQFARTFASLIKGGVPILEALKITTDTLGNHYYKDSLRDAQEHITKGETLHTIMAKYPALYPPMVVQMVEVGEETGKLADVLERLAEFYEEEVSAITQNMSSIVEPVLMIFIGCAVGFFAVSMIQPMYEFMGKI